MGTTKFDRATQAFLKQHATLGLPVKGTIRVWQNSPVGTRGTKDHERQGGGALFLEGLILGT